MHLRIPFICILYLVGVAILSNGVDSALSAEETGTQKPVDAEHAEKMAAGLKLFREQVRGLLVGRCLECHGGEYTEAEFDLSTRDALLRGGAAGKAIQPGSAAKSRLVQLITHEVAPEMPYEEGKLKDAEIAAITKWIDLGAPYDKPLKAADAEEVPWTEQRVDPAAKNYWAFQPLPTIEPPTPKRSDWARTPIDRFILAKLEADDLQPNPMARPRTLIRRIYFDLIGLPPTPQEVEAFLRDCGVDPAKATSEESEIRIPHSAIQKLVDRLLASEHYGERWARHWLDVARFAESHGFEQDYDRPHAYHYRDFVIKALNQDMPYDQFVRWQIAGDEIAPDDPLAMMATGFLGAGVFPTQLTEKEFESARYDELDDMVATIGTSMLGLTIGCARCHDHKYDPIPQADYYRMVSTFTTTIRSEIELNVPDPQSGDMKKTKVMVCSEGVPKMKHHADGRGFPHFYPKTYYLKRGDPNQKQGEAPQGFLQVLMRSEPPAESGEQTLAESASDSVDPVALSKTWRVEPPDGWRTSYRRRSLANWMTDVDRGAGDLLARVIVNRVWHHHFGRGLVPTPNDFGAQAERPSHPQLLDWLAADFIAHGWQMKRLHRQILTSSVYLQSSDYDESKAKSDPDNRLLWRYKPQRLEAEAIRDAMLAVSGQLDRRMFGPGTLDEGMRRRSIYFTIKRSKLIPMMQLFDQPEPLVSQGRRPATTIAPQALLFMNNDHVRGYARAFAVRLASAAEQSLADAVREGYRIALARPPTEEEVQTNVAFLERQTESYAAENKADARQLALADFCQVLFSLNEFVFVE